LTVVLYPGSFDPVHNGHLEIVEIAARLFDEVVVAAMRNPQKGEPLFSLTERKAMLVIPSASSRSFIASKLIREIARFGGDVASMVPEPVAKRLRDKYGTP